MTKYTFRVVVCSSTGYGVRHRSVPAQVAGVVVRYSSRWHSCGWCGCSCNGVASVRDPRGMTAQWCEVGHPQVHQQHPMIVACQGSRAWNMQCCGCCGFLPAGLLSIPYAYLGSPQCNLGGPAYMGWHPGSRCDSHSGGSRGRCKWRVKVGVQRSQVRVCCR